MSILLEIAHTAVKLYAETHPRPVHINQTQAAQMLGLSGAMISKLVRRGDIALNNLGYIPITEIDRIIEKKKLCKK